MRNKHLLLALAVLLLPPALAGAATLDQLTATADCNAWSSEVTIAFRPGATMVLLVFDMQLADAADVEIESYHWEQWLQIPADTTATYPFGASWQAPLDRPATLYVNANVYDARGDSFSLTQGEVVTPLTCPPADDGGGTPVEVCRHASHWWLRHVREWPVSSLTLGDTDYDLPALERLLHSPFRGQVNRRLSHQLAVTKLNLANGVTNDIATVVAAADAWLVAHPAEVRGRHHEPRQDARREALRLIKDLHRWNHGGCRDGAALQGDDGEESGKDGLTLDSGPTDQEFAGDLGDDPNPDKAAVENTSLGALKAMYR
jgi:hypothetical protein